MEGLKSIISNIAQVLNYINPFNENFILKPVIEILGNILDFLNPFSDNFFVYKLIELLGNLLNSIFVPDINEIESSFNTVKEKFSFIDGIKGTINDLTTVVINEDNSPIFEIEVFENKYFSGNVKVIDLSWYAPFKNYGDTVICCFAYAFFFWRIFIKLPSIIDGAGANIESENSSDSVRFKKGGNKS